MKASSLLQIATTVAILPLASAETNSNNHTPLRHSHNSNNNNNKHSSRHSNNRRRATTESDQQQQQQSQRNLEVSSSTQDEQSHMHSVTNQQWADLSSIFSQADFSLTPPQSPIKKSSLVDDDEADEEDATEREATTPTWVCNYNEACPALGSQCMRGFETCFGRTYHSFLCDCVEKDDDSGDLIYSCEVTEACAKLSTTSVASDDTEKSVSAAEAGGGGGSRSKSGKSSKSSKSSKSAKSTYHATSSSSSSSTSSMSTDASADVGNNGGGDPMAAAYTKSGKSSKSKSSKSSKYLKSSKSSEAKYQYAEKAIDTPITTDTTPKSTPSSVTSPDSTSQSTEGGSTTADPTMQPSAITLRVASTPIVTTAEPCSGQPCPFDSWCRSRYGSCGPGYAYCNSNSIWMESCNDDDESSSSSSSTTDKPTKKPTRVRDGTSNFIAGVNIRDFPEVSSSQDTAALMENVNYLGREEETVSVHGAGGAGGGTGDGAPGARMAIGMAVGLTAATLLGMGWALVIKGYYVRNLGRPPVGAREVTDVGGALGAGVATPELL